MVFIDDSYTPKFEDYVLLPRYSNVNSRSDVNLEVCYTTKYSKRVLSGIPIFCANLVAVAGKNMAIALSKHKMFTCLHKYVDDSDIEQIYLYNDLQNYVFYTLGLRIDEFIRFQQCEQSIIELGGQGIKLVCLDVANGYINKFINFVSYFREMYPNKVIMAGNVCTVEGCRKLIEAGADIIKVNIGTGNCCLTTNKAAVGRSAMKVILDCIPICNDEGVLLVSDGGYSSPAKIAKGLACGAHGIMCGSIFAATDECCGEWVEHTVDLTYEEALKVGMVLSEPEFDTKKYNGCKFVKTIFKKMKLYGMASKEANDKFCGGLKDYRAAEGQSMWVDYKGSVVDVVKDICGSLRSTCTYLNTNNLQDISHQAKFERI